MLNRYPLWKYLLILTTVVFAFIYAAPNWYGEDPALQISGIRGRTITPIQEQQLKTGLEEHRLPYSGFERMGHKQSLLIRFETEETQLKAKELLRQKLGDDYVVALSLRPHAPNWFSVIGAKPMKLGLDLRGGVHFLMQVDMDSVLTQRQEQLVDEARRFLRKEQLRYTEVHRVSEGVEVVFQEAEAAEKATAPLRREMREVVEVKPLEGSKLLLFFSEPQKKQMYDEAVEQNTTILRNRIDELGVAEALVQRQGRDRIVVELPGVQDTAEAKRVLGATATVEMHAVDETGASTSKTYYWRDGKPVLLKKHVVLSGQHITGAVMGIDGFGQPTVQINLDAAGGRIFGQFSGENINKPMAVVFVEYKVTPQGVTKIEEVINVAVIRSKLGRRFQIEGLDNVEEAKELALLLRAGSLVAPITIIEERTVGPSLGQDNIDKGTLSIKVGYLLVVLFMLMAYKVFGLIANVALFMNVIFIVAIMSLIPGATLSLPGMAGILLTVGMAVDANVLINERIREELSSGNSIQASIHAGYERAFATIADSNITTVLAALVLFMIGTGPVKGFAVTLTIGIMTSMFTAIMGTRALVNLIYGGRKVHKLMI